MRLAVIASAVLALGLVAAGCDEEGERGKTGPAGPTGPQGPSGSDGADGTDGTDGAPGSTTFAGMSDKLTDANIDDDTISGAKLSDGTVTDAKIAGLDGGKLTAGTVTDAKIDSVAASKLTGTVSSANLDVGTGANQLVALDATGKLPAVDGSQLTGLALSDAVRVHGFDELTDSSSNNLLLSPGRLCELLPNRPPRAGLVVAKPYELTFRVVTADPADQTVPGAPIAAGDLVLDLRWRFSTVTSDVYVTESAAITVTLDPSVNNDKTVVVSGTVPSPPNGPGGLPALLLDSVNVLVNATTTAQGQAISVGTLVIGP